MPSVLRARDSRGALRVVDYVGLVGVAALVRFDGEVLLTSTVEADEDLTHSAGRVARTVGTTAADLRGIVCIEVGRRCAYCSIVGPNLVLIVVPHAGVSPAAVIERLGNGVAVFDRVMHSASAPPGGGVGGGGSGGTPDPALAFVEVGRTSREEDPTRRSRS